MIDPIVDFIKILNDNEFKSKVREIPDEFDNKDELLAEIEMEGSIPPSMFYFELNGYNSPVDFEDFLEKNYNSFKISFLAKSVYRNDELIAEILDQIHYSKLALTQLRSAHIASSDITFKSLIELKIRYCEKTISFLEEKFKIIEEKGQDVGTSILSNRTIMGNNHQPNNDLSGFTGRKIVDEKEKLNEYAPVEDPSVYVFRIKKGVQNSEYKIKTLHKELKLKGYIDCTLPEFRKLFTVDQRPKLSPAPIIWNCKTYYHFSYFIQCLNRTLLSYSKNPSNNTIARKLFYSIEGVPFTTKKERFDSKSAKTQDVKAVFDKIMKNCDLKNPTTEKKNPTL